MEDSALSAFVQRPTPERGIYCNRTLNLRSIKAIGYDMDYTLIHYRMEEWERAAYEHTRARLLELGWDVGGLSFDPTLVIRGLVIDTELGNLVKANRFGYVKRASHGTRTLAFDEQRAAYERTLVDLADKRWMFINTLFSISEGCLYSQLVDLLDAGAIPDVGGYGPLYELVRRTVDEAHMLGALKAEIIAHPERFVDLDPELPVALMDQRAAGKKLLLITNSEWHYTQAMMTWALDRLLPDGQTWRDLFDVVIVSARKPDFFSTRMPLFEVVGDDGLLRPAVGGLRPGGLYHGGSASLVEAHLGLSGEQILYVGDHVFTDVHISKTLLRWRTALILRELEDEVAAIERFRPAQAELARMMREKEALERENDVLRLAMLRGHRSYGPASGFTDGALHRRSAEVRARTAELDARIVPLAQASGELVNVRWGPLLRTGNDKSHLARQVERYADIYTSRVSNFLAHTPFVYFRSPRGSLPHDPGVADVTPIEGAVPPLD